MTSFLRQLLASILLLVGIVACGKPTVFAQETLSENRFSLSITPVFQELTLQENETGLETRLQITNYSEVPQEIELFAVDFQQVDDEGRVALVTTPNDFTRFAAYITFPTKQLTLQPQTTEEFTIHVTNSVDLTPGGHYAAIVARHVKQDTPSLQQVLPGVSSFILLHKEGGAQYNLSLSNLSLSQFHLALSEPTQASLTFSNQGNVHVIPRGKVMIKDIFGREVYQGVINPSSQYVLPSTRRTLTSNISQIRSNFPLTILAVTAQGSADRGSLSFTRTEYIFYISPWMAGVVVIATIAGTIWYLKKRRKK